MRISKPLASAIALALMVGLTGCNTNYKDLTKVSGEVETGIASNEAIYRSAPDWRERAAARERIIVLRRKQLVMAERIAVGTMPEVASGAMSLAQGQSKKDGLIAAARTRYDEACALPVPISQ